MQRTGGGLRPAAASGAIDRFVAAGGERAIAEGNFGVRADYPEASFDEMQKRHGTIEKCFADGLGIDAAGQQALKTRFLGSS